MTDSPHIRIAPLEKPVAVKFHDAIVASSDNALLLEEGDYPPVIYIPREDVYFEHMTRTEKTSHCPHKGDAHYYRLSAAGEAVDNAAWTYETPKDGVSKIGGFIAFYPQHVAIEQG
ncbi:DUF427 domain-containing protein [Notoacmeibacter ruber]|uniref:DUF427 domain-containing protein n=1 Tax=Notoacmeibacter ruber TaxID=2670375 RepID=A0A3L7J9V4_9HYPH|nr:DUF427 domain-containing protein [Notoacmeibacter ruber]RLQ87473.1 DUF427 domain-containing protein [Notoacmeibacter ruber]